MERIGLTSFLTCFIFVISLHTFSQNLDAQSHPTASSSMTSPSRRTLRVGVPRRTRETELDSVEKNGTNFVFGGFCVEVFKAAITTLNYNVEYVPVLPTEIKIKNMNIYDYMIQLILLKKLDATAGDLFIASKRSQEVEFTQPFLDSGLVAVVPLKDQDIISFGWVFAKPFTAQMWLLTVAFLFFGGFVVYILEHRNNQRFQGQRREHFRNILWFSFATWFINQDDIRSVMGRIVIVTWLFVFGILQSCYTANLSAILTATSLELTLHDINSIAASNVRIGYHERSPFADLLPKYYGISKHRLVPLTKAGYYDALITRGDVGAVIDTRPFMEFLVSKHCSRLAIAGQTFTSLNLGFAFDRMHYQLARDMSDRILELSENGKLHKLRKHWLPYYDHDCSKNISDQSGTSQLQVQHFWGLFAIPGLVSAIVLLFYTVQRKWNSSRVVSPTLPPKCSVGPTPAPEDSFGYGEGGFIPGEDYGGRLDLMKKIQCSSGPTPPAEDPTGFGGGGFNHGEDYGGSLELMKEIQCLSGPTTPPEDSSGYGRGGFTPRKDYGGSLKAGV